MHYRIKAWKPGAGVSVMMLDAPDEATAGRQASALGYAVLGVAPAAALPGRGARTRFPVLLFSQELLSLLDSGIPVVEAIETLAEKEKRPLIHSVFVRILAALREGQPLSAALAAIPEAFPPLYVATVRASERTSDLGAALSRYLAYQTQVEALRGRLISAVIYPALLVIVGALVILFLLGFVVPRFAHIYEDLRGNLPLMSRLLLQWGTLVEHYWPLLLGLAAAAVLVVAHLARDGAARRWLAQQAWRLPGLGERLRLIQLARCYRTLGMLLRGGIAIVPALDLVSGLLMPDLRARLALAAGSIREGVPASAAFDANGLTTPVALRMLRVGERAGNLGEMLERCATFHDEETARWAEMATRLFGPLLMLAMGLAIGVIVVLMYLPIFQLAESIR